MKKLKYGIIGCGLIADWHSHAVRVLEKSLPVELYGVSDMNYERAKEFALKNNIIAYESLDDLLNSQVDIVSICTPSGTHSMLAVKAAEHKKHIVVEKPMAITEEQLDSIIKACDMYDVKFTSISQLRYYDAISRTKKAISDGLLGKMICGDVYMKHFRSQEYYDKGGWRGTKALDGGGAVMNQGIHGIDILQYIMGSVKTVFAKTKTLARKIEVEDTAVALLEYESGAMGVVEATTSIYPGFPRQFSFHGDKGSIRLEENCFEEWNIEGLEKPDDVIIKKTEHTSASTPDSIQMDGHVSQIGNMIESVINGTTPFIDQHEGRKAVDIILAIYESAKTGREVNIKEFIKTSSI